MTVFNRKAVSGIGEASATGPGTGFLENLGTAFESMEATELLVSENRMVNEAVSERRTKIEEVTGKPFDEAIAPFLPDENSELGIALAERDAVPVFGGNTESFAETEAINQLRASLPADQAGQILTNEHIPERAKELALERVIANEEVSARGTGFGAGAGQFIGGVAAQFTDPWVVATLPIGPASGARLSVAVAINSGLAAGVTAVQQPTVQAWRERLGLSSGLAVAAKNVLMAAAGGGGITLGLGAAVKGVGAAARLSKRETVQAFDDVVKNPTPEQTAARNQLDSEARFEEANPITPRDDTIQAVAEAEAEHARRAAAVADAMARDEPLPRFDEDGTDVDAPGQAPTRTQPIDRIAEAELLSDAGSPEARAEADFLTRGFRQRIEADGDFLVARSGSDEELVKASRVLDDFDADDAFLRELETCR